MGPPRRRKVLLLLPSSRSEANKGGIWVKVSRGQITGLHSGLPKSEVKKSG